MSNMDPLHQIMIASRQARELEKEIYQIHLQKEADASWAQHSQSFKQERFSSRKLFPKIHLVLLHAFLRQDFNLNNK